MREVEEVRQKEAYHNDFLERPRQENEEGYVMDEVMDAVMRAMSAY